MSALPDTDAFLEALHNEVLNRKLPDPPESVVQYREPPGTYDGAMAREIRPAMSDNMPIFGQKNAERAPPPPPNPANMVLGGRGMPVMMPSSPPESEADPSGSTFMNVRSSPSPATPRNAIEPDGWQGPVSWDKSMPVPVDGQSNGTDIVSLLRGMFQGAQ
jgi:hypothetical protein